MKSLLLALVLLFPTQIRADDFDEWPYDIRVFCGGQGVSQAPVVACLVDSELTVKTEKSVGHYGTLWLVGRDNPGASSIRVEVRQRFEAEAWNTAAPGLYLYLEIRNRRTKKILYSGTAASGHRVSFRNWPLN